MEFKVLSVVVIYIVVVSAAAEKKEDQASEILNEALKKLDMDDYDAGYALASIYTGGFAPKYDIPAEANEDAEFLRALTAFVLYDGDFNGESKLSEKTSQEFRSRFSAAIEIPCQHIIETVKEPLSSAAKIETESGTKGFWVEKWVGVEYLCEKVTSKPDEWSDMSFKVAEMNKDKNMTI